ncbi:putative Transcription factor domain-containing protein [Seiridium cardinale]
MTPQSVLGLLILSIAALGEMKFEYQNGWINRAISMSLEIGMQHKTFADTTADPILAESHRRVYWGLYLLDWVRLACDPSEKMMLHEGIGDVDLPCEEWEYDAGQIPPSISLAQYDLQNKLGSAEFSSWTYLIDMCRISRKLILPFRDSSDEKKLELFERADSLLCDWLIKLPQWKMDLVDSGGVADMILFHAIAFAQQNRLSIRQCASRQGLNLRQTFPLGPARGPHRQAQKIKAFGWNAIPIDVQAANSVCRLFRESFPTKNLSPLCLPGLLWVAVAYLDACVFLGLDTPDHREKLNMLLHIMTAHGNIWAISRKIADEVQEVARDYSILSHSPKQDSVGDSWISGATSRATDDIALPMESDFPTYPDLGIIDNWADSFGGTI